MKINFIGSFTNGYVGEVADQVHLAREMEDLGHIVRRVPQDIWKASCDGETNPDWNNQLPMPDADINIITKWHHFNDRKYIERLRVFTHGPVFYWVWDYMYDQALPGWHLEMVMASDLYLGNDIHSLEYLSPRNPYYRDIREKLYYFPFDVADGDIPSVQIPEARKIYDVTFFGSCIGQGNRIEWLKEINKHHHVKIFAWNPEEWKKHGFEDAEPAVYGMDFATKIGQSKIVLGLSVEPDCWGYWSNRVGKVLLAGGFLLYQYAPGMELFLRDGVEYFSSINEACGKIDYYLLDKEKRSQIAHRGHTIALDRFTSQERVKELMILADRFIKTKGKGWQI